MKKIFRVLGILFIVFSFSSCGKESTPTTPKIPTPDIPAKKLPIINNFSINPNSCWYREDVMAILSWNVTDASKVEIDQGIGAVESSGSKQIKPTKTMTWILTATNSDGTSTRQCTFQVNRRPGAYFILVSWEKRYTDYDCPSANGIVRNDGSKPGYNVMIVFTAYNASNVIIDTANGFPANLNTIGVDESATFEAVFFSVHRWYDIDHINYKITWLDVSGMRLQQIGRLF